MLSHFTVKEYIQHEIETNQKYEEINRKYEGFKAKTNGRNADKHSGRII